MAKRPRCPICKKTYAESAGHDCPLDNRQKRYERKKGQGGFVRIHPWVKEEHREAALAAMKQFQ